MSISLSISYIYIYIYRSIYLPTYLSIYAVPVAHRFAACPAVPFVCALYYD